MFHLCKELGLGYHLGSDGQQDTQIQLELERFDLPSNNNLLNTIQMVLLSLLSCNTALLDILYTDCSLRGQESLNSVLVDSPQGDVYLLHRNIQQDR
jgi:hypothetical protein